MKNLNGYFKKILLIFSILFSSILLFNKVHASDFPTYTDFYHVWDGNTVNSSVYLTLTTKSASTVITSYTITIPDEDIDPKVFLINRNTQLEPTIHRRESATDIVLDLKNMPLSKSKPIKLRLNYSTKISEDSFNLISAVKDTIPRTFSFTYPSSKGDVTWISSPIVSIKSLGNNTEVFTSPPQTNKVKISLSESIVYKYEISRNLINMGEELIISEVTLPINNSFQHILIESIEPLPDKAYKDIDGNYILQYGIAPLSNLDVVVNGYIVMNRSMYPYDLTYSIEADKIWKITDTSLIRHVNRYLKEKGLNVTETFSNIDTLSTTAERELLYNNIYRYVIDNLKPNALTLGSLTGAERVGGQEPLIKQSESTSEAYADSIIALYRNYNIPARLVIGYVTNISNLHPEGIYHYLAEYFDVEKNDWIIVDPFLEDYSLTPLWQREMKDHVALIYRYSNPNTPKLPYFSAKDFQIEKIEKSPIMVHDLQLELLFEPYKITNPYFIGSINITNIGNTVLDMFKITKSNPDLIRYIDYIENNSQVILLPGQSHRIKFNIPIEEIEEDLFAVIDAYSGTTEIKDNYVDEDIEIMREHRNLDILSKLLSVLIYVICVVGFFYISKKLKIKNG